MAFEYEVAVVGPDKSISVLAASLKEKVEPYLNDGWKTSGTVVCTPDQSDGTRQTDPVFSLMQMLKKQTDG